MKTNTTTSNYVIIIGKNEMFYLWRVKEKGGLLYIEFCINIINNYNGNKVNKQKY